MERKIQEPKVSVIVPMYKCESFAEDCLDMICGQTFSDIEIICVLDGPDAKVREIVESKQKEDDRIILIEQDHAGAGVARNNGLDRARGDYLLFLDADDLFSHDLIERLYGEAVKYDVDVVMCSYVQDNNWMRTANERTGFDYSLFPENEVIDPSNMEKCFGSMVCVPWNKLFRRSMIVENELRFSSTRMMNDVFFVVAAMTCARRLVVIKKDMITSRRFINDDSISTNRAKYLEDLVEVTDEIYCWLRETGRWKKKRSDYCQLFKNSFNYETSFDRNESFFDRIACTLSTKTPWKQMSNAEMTELLSLDMKKLKARRNTFADEMHLLNSEEDAGRNHQLRMMDNRINALEEICSLMKNKYGRDIEKKDNPFKLFGWLVRTKGLKKTVKILIHSHRKAQVIKPEGVLCAGHLTTRCGYITFFMPIKVERDTAEIEDMSIVVRCNGYYPRAISGYYDEKLTPLGPKRVPIVNRGTPSRENEIGGVTATVIPGFGIRFQIRFKTALVRNDNRDKAHNNNPVSVMMTGKIRLKNSGVN